MEKKSFTVEEGWNKGIAYDRIITDTTDTSLKYVLDTTSCIKFLGILIKRPVNTATDLLLYLEDIQSRERFIFINNTGTNQWRDLQLVYLNSILILPGLNLVLEINPVNPNTLVWIIYSKAINLSYS